MVQWDEVNKRIDMIERVRALFIAGRVTAAQLKVIEDKAQAEIAELLKPVTPS